MNYQVNVAQVLGKRELQEDCLCLYFDREIFSLQNNERHFFQCSNYLLIALCDGMGGHEAGEVASNQASKTFIKSLLKAESNNISESLMQSLQIANLCLAEEIELNSEYSGMGTTIVGAIIHNNVLNWISVGDSHLYLYRDSKLVKLNQDHSMVPVINQMVKQGLISSSEAMNHPDRNALRSVLMGDQVELIDTGIHDFILKKNDLLIFATDGIDLLDEQMLIKNIKKKFWKNKHLPADNIVDCITKMDIQNTDNISVITIEIS